ncbi:MAG: hypothetical protein IPP30_06060 [Flavobacterium sp.]|nr:hypothetical protein [Flavobacterium sp.]
MSKKYRYFLFLTCCCFNGIFAQEAKDSLVIQSKFRFGNTPLELHTKYVSNSDTLEIETFKYYISNIEVQFADKTIVKPKSNYHLVDIENPASFSIPIEKKQNKFISKVTFDIGVDSIASVSGALGGDLDPAKGMYWAWQSGYINMKIEGKSNSCKTRKNQFQFHLGGYLKPNYALRKIEIPIQKNQIPNEEINIIVDLGHLFSEISLKETNSIMLPGKAAMEIADLSAKIFSVE